MRLRVLGPLERAEILPDGRIKPLTPIGGGEVPTAMLLALIFYPHGDTYKVARRVWGDAYVDGAIRNGNEDEMRWRVSQYKGRLRRRLGEEYGDLIPKGGREGPRLRRDPMRLVLDWDDLLKAFKNRQHARVLSLANEPLPGVDRYEYAEYQELEAIRDQVRDYVARSSKALGIELPEHFKLGKHLPDGFELDLPDIWQQRPEPVRKIFIPAPRKRPRVSDPDSSSALFTDEELFGVNTQGEARLESELAEARASGSRIWWEPKEGKWLGGYYAFWHTPHSIPAHEIKIDYVFEDRCDSARYEIPTSEPNPPYDGDNEKAIIVETSQMFSDNRDHKRLLCAKTTWNFAQDWASKNGQRILDSRSRPSVFGLGDRPPYPAIAGAHALVRTHDGYLLFGLRSTGVDYYPLQWSASFEESFSVVAREFTGNANGDQYLSDAVVGGLYEEWGIDEEEVEEISCLAVGHQFVTDEEQLDLSSTAIVGVQLNIDLKTVWERLDERTRIRDRNEHRSWAGCRFASRSDVVRFLFATRQHPRGTDLLQKAKATSKCNMDLEIYPGGATSDVEYMGFMPTSPARLFLGSAWLRESGLLQA